MFMRFEGQIVRDGRWWLAEVPILEAMTQGRIRKEALAMIGDWLETMIDRKGFEAQVYPLSPTTFEIAGNNAAALTELLLRRRREASGTSLRDMATGLAPHRGTPTPGTNVVTRYRRSGNSTLC